MGLLADPSLHGVLSSRLSMEEAANCSRKRVFLERVLEARRPPSPAGAQPQWPFPDPPSCELLWPNTERRKNETEKKLVHMSREGIPKFTASDAKVPMQVFERR